MDQQSEQRLAEITSKEPASLTGADIEFLRARRSYLNEEQLAVFKGVLGDEPKASEASDESSEEVTEEKPKRGKKGE